MPHKADTTYVTHVCMYHMAKIKNICFFIV